MKLSTNVGEWHGTWQNIVRMQDDIRMTVFGLYYEPLRFENDGLHCEFAVHSCSNGIGVSYRVRDTRVNNTPIYLIPHAW